jgi:hypothetical protein
MNKKLVLYGLYAALGETAYVLLVALFMKYGSNLFGPDPSIFGAMAFLMLFVLSAAISGALVLGKPILLYLEGSKKEAVELFGATLGWIFILVVVILAATVL